MTNKKKLLLIWPFNMHARKNPELFPIGIGYLLDNLNDELYDVEFLDCSIEDIHPESETFVKRIRSINPDLVGLSWWSNNTPLVDTTIDMVKSTLPDVQIVVGGPHPSAYGHRLIRDPNIDYVFYGEAEVGFPKLMERLAASDFTPLASAEMQAIEGLIYIDETGSVQKNEQALAKQLDELGGLDYERLSLRRYQEKGYTYGGKAIKTNELTAPMVVTRGCPYKCNFCAAPAMNGRQLRRHSPEYVIDQVKHLYNDHGVRHIAFVDDNFTLNTKWALKIALALGDLGYDDLIFSTPNGIRLTRMNLELAKAMKRAGWRELVLAPETGSPKTILEMDKDLDLNVVPGVIDMLHEADLAVAAFFIIGYPSETMEDLALTEQFIAVNDWDEIYLHIFQPLPGTPIFDRLVDQGHITADFVPGSYQQVTFKPHTLEKDQVQSAYNRILSAFEARKGDIAGRRTRAIVREHNHQLYGHETYNLNK